MTVVPANDGFLLVDKPIGVTSHDVVAIARRATGIRSIGHTGTLDPFASGLLLLAVGRATRLAEYLAGFPKVYFARAVLGSRTATDDLEGEVLSESSAWEGLTPEAIEVTLRGFLGVSEQRPPAYSAKKVAGRRAHALARRGEEVDLAAVPIEVSAIELLDVELPRVAFRVSCSTGTYIRALARDLGDRLGVGAHLSELRRLEIGPFSVEAARTLEELKGGVAAGAAWVPPLQALSHLQRVEVDPGEVTRVRMGQAVPLEEGRLGEGTKGEVVLAREGELVAMARWDGERLYPRKVFMNENAAE